MCDGNHKGRKVGVSDWLHRLDLINKYVESTSLRLPSTRATLHSPDSSLPSLKSYLNTTGEPTRDHIDFNPELHHDYPRLLKIGTRDTDGTDVWINFLKGEKTPSRCFHENLQLTSIHKLGTVWLPELQLDLFNGECRSSKGGFYSERCTRRGEFAAGELATGNFTV